MSITATGDRPGPAGTGRRLDARLPGLAVSALAVAAAEGVHRLLGGLPTLTAAILLGVAAANSGVLPAATGPGLRVAGSTLMRAGIVLLGLQVTLGDVAGLGWRTIAMVLAVLALTFAGTRRLGRLLGLSPRLSLLIAAGFAICGNSAVGAVDGALGTRPGDREAERESATAVALVTLCGSLAIAVLPPLGRPLGLAPYDLGRWVGASVHDVGQVVATATVVGAPAVVPAVAVKLIRVAMLAPIAAAIALRVRRPSAPDHADRGRRQPIVPLFLAGFLAAIALRATGMIPAGALDGASTIKDVLFAAALFGLGSAVRVRELTRTGPRAALLGLASWLLIATSSYAGVLLTS